MGYFDALFIENSTVCFTVNMLLKHVNIPSSSWHVLSKCVESSTYLALGLLTDC